MLNVRRDAGLVVVIVAALAVILIAAPAPRQDAAAPARIGPPVAGLPTAGPAWDSLVAAAGANASPDLCDQDDKADVVALANALVYARTGQTAYQTRAIGLIDAAVASQRDGCNNAVLALGRQLGGYVLAADYAGDHDATFVAWLSAIRTRDIGGHGRWHVLRDTSRNSANNWGLWATASLVAADAYLGDADALAGDWAVYSGYGDGSWPFQKTSSWSAAWSCVAGSGSRLPIGINPPGCTLADGYDGDGAPVEDASRSGFPSASTYIHEAVDPLTISALLLAQAGYPAWTVNAGQVCRAGSFANRAGRLNDWAGSYFAAWVLDPACGLDLPKKTPTVSGRLLGFTDWLFGSGAVPSTPSSAPTSTPQTPAPTVAPTATASLSPSPSPTASPTASPTLAIDPVISALDASRLSPADRALLEALYRRLLP